MELRVLYFSIITLPNVQAIIRGGFHEKITGESKVRRRGGRGGRDDPVDIFKSGSKSPKSKPSRPPARRTPPQKKAQPPRQLSQAELNKQFKETQASSAPAVPAAYRAKQIEPQAAPSVFKKDEVEKVDKLTELQRKSAESVAAREALDKPVVEEVVKEESIPSTPIPDSPATKLKQKKDAEIVLDSAGKDSQTDLVPTDINEVESAELATTDEEVKTIDVKVETMKVESDLQEGVEIIIEPVRIEELVAIPVKAEPVASAPPGSTEIIANPHLEGTMKKSMVVVEKKVGSFRPKRRRRTDQSGGGRQPKTKKLSLRKYLEYKYEVKDILDHEGIEEEQRSNILGQIWAKGERIGIDAAIEFIEVKRAELIIPDEIAAKLKSLVYSYTTRR